MIKKIQQNFTLFVGLLILISVLCGGLAGGAATYLVWLKIGHTGFGKSDQTEQLAGVRPAEKAVTDIVAQASPAVVSIIVSKDLPVIEKKLKDFNPFDFFNSPFDFFSVPQYEYQQNGTQKQEIGGGTGFFISSDGLIITNKHVVADESAKYTVLVNENEKVPAVVLARDSVQDLAILKIDKKDMPFLSLGDSDQLKIGQTVIAIGNALGEFRNTVSVGVVSGLQRSITASTGASSEELQGVIQTDAAVNPGNSGGPLLNTRGEVVGINVAIAQGAQNIAFALPINAAKKDIDMAKTRGKITYPYLGVRYTMIDRALAQKNNLAVDYGALIRQGAQSDQLAVAPGSPADKANLVENDIILEVDGTRVESGNNLAKLIQAKAVGQTIKLKILHKGEEKTVFVVLGENK